MTEGNKKWYVVRAISGKEAKVKEILDAACKNVESLGSHLYQVLVPTEKVYTTRGGKKVLKERNLFSGYVFIQADLTGEVEELIRNTSNVIDFVRGRDSAHKPEAIRETEIARMLGAAQADEGAEDNEVSSDFIVGETVKVNYGPFNGFIGRVDEVYREKRKLKVMVKVFGRETPLELDNSQVERE